VENKMFGDKHVMINGFGRIGRNFFRIAWENSDIHIEYINDLFDPKYLAYALKYDTVFGRFPGTVKAKEGALIIDGDEVPVLAERDPGNLPHTKYNIDVAVESSGFFTEREKAKKHLKAGAEKVLITAPAKNPDVTVVMGCNDDKITKEHKIISNASCTTNCLAPIVKVLDDSFKVQNGFITTVHSFTGTQAPVDSVKAGKEVKMTRGRSCSENIVPTSTGAAIAIGEIFPHLKGDLDGMALRVPTVDGSIVDCKINVEKSPTIDEVNNKMKEYSEGKLKGILDYIEDPIVSKDIVGNTHSSVFCPIWTKTNKNLVFVISLFDNEWGFSNRLVDVITKKL
jgi:glyceraldehyde 3-phosphate dehydrogenase